MSAPALRLKLTNTLGGRMEPLQPLQPGLVRMYHCGPTVIGTVSIDKFRSYLLGDVLRRYLELLGLEVRQAMNITDVGHLNAFEEDAVELAASRAGLSAVELVEREEKAFHDDRRAVGILDAHHYPRAQDHVGEMIEFIERLLEAGAAYRVGGNIYFDSSRAASLGRLAGRSREDLEALQRAAPSTSPAGSPAQGRTHPLDFDLWRSDPLHQSHWKSPWGRGFPGWHVECVVMSRKYLGQTFDVHSGSRENIYPHHECEIAQAEAAGGGPLARVWLHSEHVLLDGKPISRANRNLISVRGLLESGVGGAEVRGALLSVHYREPLEFQPEALEEAAQTISLLRAARDRHRAGQGAAEPASEPPEELRKKIETAEEEFHASMEDDLDVPRALEAARALARELEAAPGGPFPRAARALESFDRVLGFFPSVFP